MDIDLIKKYNVQGPRYTSYPTAVQFETASPNEREAMRQYLAGRNRGPHPVSLYFHIPFCFSLCWYCGCTKVISREQDRGDGYIDYLEKEMDRVSERLHPDSNVTQVHFGGGTPTFLKPRQLRRLGKAIKKRFKLSDKTEFGVEIDPRRCTMEHLEALREIGCNRASLGIQDTNPDVQKAIHRIQPHEQNRKVTEGLRSLGIDSINFDLIYGLPRQTLDTFGETIDDILQLKPDRLAVYSYAHIPTIMPAQKLLKTEELPSTDEKLGMLQYSISHLTESGYRFIGMDHFSREGEELTLAMDNDTLQRNFQGYSTHSGADLYAFGMSGISNVGEYYWQNSKEINDYYHLLDEGQPPVARMLHLNRDDLLRREVIMQLMCRRRVEKSGIEQKWDIQFDRYFKKALKQLKTLEKDQLVKVDSRFIEITSLGRLFLRNIAMCFDYHIQTNNSVRSFSKTV